MGGQVPAFVSKYRVHPYPGAKAILVSVKSDLHTNMIKSGTACCQGHSARKHPDALG